MIKFNKTGMSLVEVLVAIVIVAVAMVPLTFLFFMNLVLLDKTWDLTSVMAQAENKLEEMRSRPFAEIKYYKGKIVTFELTKPAGSGVIFVEDAPVAASNDLLKITVSALWKDSRSGKQIGSNENYPVVLETFLAKR